MPDTLNELIEDTKKNLHKIIDLGRQEQAIPIETQETLTSTIDELSEIKPGAYPLYFCVGCGEDFEEESDTMPLDDHPSEIVGKFSTYGQGFKEEDHIPESICDTCLETYN